MYERDARTSAQTALPADESGSAKDILAADLAVEYAALHAEMVSLLQHVPFDAAAATELRHCILNLASRALEAGLDPLFQAANIDQSDLGILTTASLGRPNEHAGGN
jgi:hypothetical protein